MPRIVWDIEVDEIVYLDFLHWPVSMLVHVALPCGFIILHPYMVNRRRLFRTVTLEIHKSPAQFLGI